MQVLILASGEQTRWEQAGKPTHRKQLLKVAGETIVARIVRQCRARGHDPIIVTHHDDIIQATDATCVPVTMRRWTVETLLSTRLYWRKRTVVLLGDVIYSRTVMDRIFACSDPLRVFGHEFEILALSFAECAHSEVERALNVAIAHAADGGPGKLRKFYQAYCGLDLDGEEMESVVLDRVCHVSDYTQDIDTPKEWKRFRRQVIRGGLLDDLKR